MKVKETNDIARVNEVTPRAPVTKGAEVPPGTQDKVSLPASKEFKEAVDAAKRSAGATRSAEVAALEAAVKRGDYSINPRQIAQRILDAAEVNAQLTALLKR